ncbi:MAG: hypothetical protein ACUBOA_14150 [Candidatus Loosdrechtia sp.]|uniref:hypothetical protein n=1 Tax=Candidatus Loosdrechtia sp. TaxID=3101272 RepID=UPI003A6B7EFB|nr:MAG: hypothetical protein QY305_03945 [Candidatus Jettenia sp. AMX2]
MAPTLYLTLIGEADLNGSVLAQMDWEIDGLPLAHTVDLSIFRQISDPEVIDHIRRVGVVFCKREIKTSHA